MLNGRRIIAEKPEALSAMKGSHRLTKDGARRMEKPEGIIASPLENLKPQVPHVPPLTLNVKRRRRIETEGTLRRRKQPPPRNPGSIDNHMKMRMPGPGLDVPGQTPGHKSTRDGINPDTATLKTAKALQKTIDRRLQTTLGDIRQG